MSESTESLLSKIAAATLRTEKHTLYGNLIATTKAAQRIAFAKQAFDYALSDTSADRTVEALQWVTYSFHIESLHKELYEFTEQYLPLLKKQHSPSIHAAYIYHHYSYALLQLGKFSGTQTYIDSALEIFTSHNQHQESVKVMASKVWCLGELGLFDSAIEWGEKCRNNANIFQMNYYHSWMEMAIGFAYHNKGQNERALTHIQKAIELMKSSGQSEVNLTGPYINIACIYLALQVYDKALFYYTLVLEIAEKYSEFYVKAIALTDIAEIYFTQNDFQTATQYYEAAFEAAQNQDSSVYAKIYPNAGKAFLATNNNEKAALYFSKGAELSAAESQNVYYVLSLCGLARCAIQKQDYSQAHDTLEKALLIAEQYELTFQIGIIYNTLGDLHSNNFIRAKELYEKSLHYFQGADTIYMQNHVLQALTDLCEKNAMFKDAFFYQKALYNMTLDQHNSFSLEQKNTLEAHINLEQYKKEKKSLQEQLYYTQSLLQTKTHESEILFKQLIKYQQYNSFVIADTLSDSTNIIDTENISLTDHFDIGSKENGIFVSKSHFAGALSALYPSLSQNELQICTLLIIDWSSKQIAQFLNKSVAVIDKYKIKIREKMKIASYKELLVVLKNIDKGSIISQLQTQTVHDVLTQFYPQLSKQEIKICALIVKGLSTSEISSHFFASERTIENHRFRIRKKLNITATDNLYTALNGILHSHTHEV